MAPNLARATPRARDFYAHDTVQEAFAAVQSMHGVTMTDVEGGSAAKPAIQERASSAFRAATRIIEKRKDRKG